MSELAPIVLFVYNRPYHTKKTIQSLAENTLASDSYLFVYCDGPKNDLDSNQVRDVRQYIHQISGFKKKEIFERNDNLGLKESIISGVSEIIKQYDKIIVLEDDLVTSPYFLKYMNEALEFYKEEKNVWHINGWNYPINTRSLDDTFFIWVMSCWGWATWSDRWKHLKINADEIIDEFSQNEINKFNIYGAINFWNQIIANKEGRINTWAVFWYATIFKQNGLCLTPAKTFIKNIGIDGSGVHRINSNIFKDNLSLKKDIYYTRDIRVDNLALDKIINYYKLKHSFFIKILYKIASFICKC